MNARSPGEHADAHFTPIPERKKKPVAASEENKDTAAEAGGVNPETIIQS